MNWVFIIGDYSRLWCMEIGLYDVYLFVCLFVKRYVLWNGFVSVKVLDMIDNFINGD